MTLLRAAFKWDISFDPIRNGASSGPVGLRRGGRKGILALAWNQRSA
jgi:hypothetical protein